jgi:hypothetical protein
MYNRRTHKHPATSTEIKVQDQRRWLPRQTLRSLQGTRRPDETTCTLRPIPYRRSVPILRSSTPLVGQRRYQRRVAEEWDDPGAYPRADTDPNFCVVLRRPKRSNGSLIHTRQHYLIAKAQQVTPDAAFR